MSGTSVPVTDWCRSHPYPKDTTMTRPGDHTPATPRQDHIMNSDAALSKVIEQAVQDKNFDLVVDAMAEKVDLERALDASRTDSWNTWFQQQTGGDAA